MTEIYNLERKSLGVSFPISYILFTIIVTYMSTLIIGTLQLGFLGPLEVLFLSTTLVFGIPANLYAIVTYLIGFVILLKFTSHSIFVNFRLEDGYLIKTVSKGKSSVEKRFRIKDIDYFTTSSVTTVTRTSTPTSSGGTISGVSSHTFHNVELIFGGVNFSKEIIFKDEDQVNTSHLAKQLKEKTSIKFQES